MFAEFNLVYLNLASFTHLHTLTLFFFVVSLRFTCFLPFYPMLII